MAALKCVGSHSAWLAMLSAARTARLASLGSHRHRSVRTARLEPLGLHRSARTDWLTHVSARTHLGSHRSARTTRIEPLGSHRSARIARLAPLGYTALLALLGSDRSARIALLAPLGSHRVCVLPTLVHVWLGPLCYSRRLLEPVGFSIMCVRDA